MALLSPRVGARIVLTMGRKGEAPDLYNGVIVGQPQMLPVPGRNFLALFAEVVYKAFNLQTNQPYLARKIHNLNFSFDRTERDVLLDGDEQAPKTWQDIVVEQTKASLAHAMSRPRSDAPSAISVTEITQEEINAAEAAI